MDIQHRAPEFRPNTEAPLPVLIDCDPGIDDAFALALALHHPRLNVVGVTTVAGNQTIEHVSRNALDLVSFFGRPDTPVCVGATAPLERKQITASSHGTDGLGGRQLPPSPRGFVGADGPGFIIRAIRQAHDAGDPLTIIAIGPLTNLATAAGRDPEIVSLVREVVIMGGGEHAGNMTPVAEFNFYADPEAAEQTLAAGWPIRLCGLPLTWQSAVPFEQAERLAALAGDMPEALSAWLKFYSRGETTPGADGPALHDAVAVAWAIDASIVESEPAFATCETKGFWTYGENVIDREGAYGKPANVTLGVTLDRDAFWNMLIGTVAAAGTAEEASRA